MSHVEYFNVAGYFNSLLYVNCLGIDLASRRIGGLNLTPSEVQKLEDAIRAANLSSDHGNLAGVINLIETAEGIIDRYGLPADCEHHRQTITELLEEISTQPEIVKRYGLEKYVRLQRQKPETIVGTTTKKAKKCQ